MVYYVSTAIVISASYDTERNATRDPMKTPDTTSNHVNVRTIRVKFSSFNFVLFLIFLAESCFWFYASSFMMLIEHSYHSNLS